MYLERVIEILKRLGKSEFSYNLQNLFSVLDVPDTRLSTVVSSSEQVSCGNYGPTRKADMEK